jgi:hypothetical protein
VWYLTEYILKARPHGFVGAIIWGDRSIGKSAYALKVAHQLFLHDGCSDKEAWENAIDSCVFLIEDLILKVRQYNYRNRAKIIIWDDAGYHGSGLLYFLNLANAMMLKGITDTLRTSTESFLLTTPSTKSLISFLKDYGDYEIKIVKDRGWERLAHLRKERIEPWGKKRKIDRGTDAFSAYMPNEYYHKYMRQRDRYKEIILREIEEWNMKKEQKKQEKGFIGQTSKPIAQSGSIL